MLPAVDFVLTLVETQAGGLEDKNFVKSFWHKYSVISYYCNCGLDIEFKSSSHLISSLLETHGLLHIIIFMQDIERLYFVWSVKCEGQGEKSNVSINLLTMPCTQ